MQGVLILAHGSREKETEKTLNGVVAVLKERLQSVAVEKAFLQFSETNLEKGLLKLVQAGVTDIKVIPYFLFEGVHFKKDIPEEIKEFNQKYPQVTITLGRTLGGDSRLVEILEERVKGL